MGRRRAKSPFEDNPVIDGFLEWMDAPEGQQSIEALDLVFDALQHAGVDARQRKIVWADGKRLSIEQSAERIHAGHPDVACDVIETHVLGWLEAVRWKPTPSANSSNSTGSSNRGSTTMSARHGPSESSRELGTLEVPLRSCNLRIISRRCCVSSPESVSISRIRIACCDEERRNRSMLDEGLFRQRNPTRNPMLRSP